VKGTLGIYHELRRKLVASPARAHCVFSLHDVSHVFAGMSLMSASHTRTVASTVRHSHARVVTLVRLWCHEVVRVFADRLLTVEGDVPRNGLDVLKVPRSCDDRQKFSHLLPFVD